MPYPLSRELTEARLRVDTLDNAGLAFFRYLPKDIKDDGNRGHLDQIAKRFGDRGTWDEAAVFHAARLNAAAEAFRGQGRPVEIVEAKTVTRLLVGTGYKNALDIGLTFHPAGFPFLPGSAVKGLCRAWAEDVAAQPKHLLKRVFGTESKDEKEEAGAMVAGSVCFLDALPLAFPKLDVDLLNPHYPRWYREEQGAAPVDWDQPNIVPFLAVAAGQEFRFLLVGRTEADGTFVNVARGWLEEALAHLGVGAKTAAGYGSFDTLKVPEKKPRPSTPRAAPVVQQASPPPPPVPAVAPEKQASVGKNNTDVPAQVTGHKGKMLLVRLHVQEYERDVFEVGGVNGPEFAQVGEWITVNVNVNKKSKRVTQVSGPKRLS